MSYMTFGEDDFNVWYSQLYKQERQQFNKEITQYLNKAIEKYCNSLTDIKDVNIGEPCTFTPEKFTSLSNNIYLKYKNKEE